MDKAKVLEIVKQNINLGGLVADTLDEILEPALLKLVKSTSNPFDDALMATVYPLLEKELKELVEAGVNKLFDKLEGNSEEVSS